MFNSKNMLLHKNINKISAGIIRQFCSKRKPKIKLDEEVNSNLENAAFKPRNHPGRIKPKTVAVPERLLQAIENVVQDYPIKSLVSDSKLFGRHLQRRMPPVENAELAKMRKTILREILQEEGDKELHTEKDQQRFKDHVKDKLQLKMKRAVYNWQSINYNTYNSLLYLFARFAQDYAVLVRTFSEIHSRDGDFKPRSFFDFGSGTGTATWAANVYWEKDIFEYFNVDSSSDMNDLALILRQGGRGTKSINTKGTFYRQFLPANNIAYDLVVCAYSLLELPSIRSRLQTIINLWNKTAGYLIVVEYGTNAGFKVINEVRDFILNIEDEANVGHVFSPCPHDQMCPRFVTDNTPCNFSVKYRSLPFGGPSDILTEQFSYVILKRGKRNADDPRWPRIVRNTLVRSKHTICRMCTKNCKLEEVIFTASKHGKAAYYCARSSEWGDLLPIHIHNDAPKEEDSK